MSPMPERRRRSAQGSDKRLDLPTPRMVLDWLRRRRVTKWSSKVASTAGNSASEEP